MVQGKTNVIAAVQHGEKKKTNCDNYGYKNQQPIK